MIREPNIVYQWQETRLWGLVNILYYIEDRRPDLEEYPPGKYKNWIRVTVFGREYRWTYRTNDLYNDLPYTEK